MSHTAQSAVLTMTACHGYVPSAHGAQTCTLANAAKDILFKRPDILCIQVCTLLTSYLLRQYPAESAQRAAEVKREVGSLQ
jgi:hypothetical protein